MSNKLPERYIGKAWLIVLLPSLGLAAFGRLVATDGSHPDTHIHGLVSVLLIVVVSPIGETLLMIG